MTPAERALLGIVAIGLQFLEILVLLLLWRWFGEPLGLPPVTYWHIAGLNILINVFVYRFIPVRLLVPDSDIRDKEALLSHTAFVLMAWLTGFLIHALAM